MIPAKIGDLQERVRWMSLIRRDLRPEGRPADAGEVPLSMSTTSAWVLPRPFFVRLSVSNQDWIGSVP